MLAKWRFGRALNALADCEHAVLRDYARAAWPAKHMHAGDAPYLALDFEMDGLRRDAHLLQAGWTPFDGRSIALNQAQSIDIRSRADLDAEAVTIHGIGEQRAQRGEALAEVIAALIRALTGRILVAHAAGIERTALQRSVAKVFGEKLPIRAVCTLDLERKLTPHAVGQQPYRLGPARERYGLPDYRAHDALTDAIAAAELYQAQLTRMGDDVTLGSVEQG